MYAILWGCTNLPNNKHEQGAWILGYKNDFTNASKFLDQALRVDLKFSNALFRDFIMYNETYTGNITACTMKVCEYNQLCKNDDVYDDDSDDYVIN